MDGGSEGGADPAADGPVPRLGHRGRVRDPVPQHRATHQGMGAHVIGRKVGLTSKPMQQLLGVDEPDYGVLLDDMVVEDGDTDRAVIAGATARRGRDGVPDGTGSRRAGRHHREGAGRHRRGVALHRSGGQPCRGLEDQAGGHRRRQRLLRAVRHGRKLAQGHRIGPAADRCRRSAATERSSTPAPERRRWAIPRAASPGWPTNWQRSAPACAPATSCCRVRCTRWSTCARRLLSRRLRRNRIGHRTILGGLAHFIERKAWATAFVAGAR